MHRSRPITLVKTLVPVLAALCVSLSLPRIAAAQIKQPGAHPRYDLELDPHLVIQHAHGPFWDDDGFGLGLRASIPLVHNGPIPQINNNMAISFGGDLVFFDSDFNCRSRRNRVLGDDCDGLELWFPVNFQWNFFFTRIVSAFFEVGPSAVYWSRSWVEDCDGNPCEFDDTRFDPFEFTVFFGGRFLFGDRAGMTVRVGWPYVSIGGTFLL